MDGLLSLTYYSPFRILNKVIMPIRIRRCDNKYQDAQVVEICNTTAVVFAVSTAGYMGWRRLVFKNMGETKRHAQKRTDSIP
jgi:hypothetical protein